MASNILLYDIYLLVILKAKIIVCLVHRAPKCHIDSTVLIVKCVSSFWVSRHPGILSITTCPLSSFALAGVLYLLGNQLLGSRYWTLKGYDVKRELRKLCAKRKTLITNMQYFLSFPSLWCLPSNTGDAGDPNRLSRNPCVIIPCIKWIWWC